MENLGKYIFKSYWIQSAGTIGAAIELLKDNKKLYEQRYSAAIEMLEPYALSGNDIEYGNLLWQFAKYFRTEVRDYEKALYYHKQAQTYDENMEANYIGLMEASYILRKYQDAYSYSEKLVEFGYPNDEQALRIAIQCAIYADLRTEAMKYCLSYLQKWPDNNFIIQIKNELDVGTDLKELGPYFAY